MQRANWYLGKTVGGVRRVVFWQQNTSSDASSPSHDAALQPLQPTPPAGMRQGKVYSRQEYKEFLKRSRAAAPAASPGAPPPGQTGGAVDDEGSRGIVAGEPGDRADGVGVSEGVGPDGRFPRPRARRVAGAAGSDQHDTADIASASSVSEGAPLSPLAQASAVAAVSGVTVVMPGAAVTAAAAVAAATTVAADQALDTPRPAASPALPHPLGEGVGRATSLPRATTNSQTQSGEDKSKFARGVGRRGAAAADGSAGLLGGLLASGGLPSVVGTAVGEKSPTKFFEEARSRAFVLCWCTVLPCCACLTRLLPCLLVADSARRAACSPVAALCLRALACLFPREPPS